MGRYGVVECDGRAMTVVEWSAVLGVSASTLRRRLAKGHPIVKTKRMQRFPPEKSGAWPGFNSKPWLEDTTARVLVARIGPMSTEQISVVTGVGVRRVRKIEAAALRKVREALEEIGAGDDPRQWLEAVREMRERRERTGWVYVG